MTGKYLIQTNNNNSKLTIRCSICGAKKFYMPAYQKGSGIYVAVCNDCDQEEKHIGDRLKRSTKQESWFDFFKRTDEKIKEELENENKC